MDIRNYNTDVIRFADDNGGTAKATKLVRHVPCQFKITRENEDGYLIISRKDLPALKKALKFAEEMWDE